MSEYYTYPVFRSGLICQSPSDLSSDAATAVLKDFEAHWDQLKKDLFKCFRESEIEVRTLSEEELNRGNKGLHLDEFEGPAIHFEHFGIKLGNFVGEFSSSLTVCRPPQPL